MHHILNAAGMTVLGMATALGSIAGSLILQLMCLGEHAAVPALSGGAAYLIYDRLAEKHGRLRS